MNIHNILYDTTRSIYSVEDKLSIATIILFCYKSSSLNFANLLYTDNHLKFIEDLNDEYKEYEIDLSVKLEDKNIRNCFQTTLEKVRERFDKDGYYKALFEGDEFALVIEEIVNYNFNEIEFKKFTKNIVQQLTLEF